MKKYFRTIFSKTNIENKNAFSHKFLAYFILTSIWDTYNLPKIYDKMWYVLESSDKAKKSFVVKWSFYMHF